MLEIHAMKLADWLATPNADGSKKRKRVFASAIGVTPTMVTEYAEGRMWPRREIMENIFRETAGQVAPNDFMQIEAAE